MTRIGRSTRLAVLSMLLGLILGCASAKQQQEQAIRTLHSWDATAQLTDELSRSGSLPSVYLRQVREAVEQGRKEAQQSAAQSSQ